MRVCDSQTFDFKSQEPLEHEVHASVALHLSHKHEADCEQSSD